MIKTYDYEGVMRVEVSKKFPSFPVNFFFVDGFLIDTGNAVCALESVNLFLERELFPRIIVNTHYHPDHTGANSFFVNRFRSKLYAHRRALPKLADPQTMFYLSLILHGRPEPSFAEAVPATIKTDNYTFQVLEIPGHCDDHIALYEPRMKWIFTGDLVFEGKAREVNVDTKIYDAIASFKKISSLDIKILFGGHGAPLINPHDLISSKIDYFEELGKKIGELRREGLTGIQIRKKIFGHERLMAYLSQKKFCAQNLVDSYLRSC